MTDLTIAIDFGNSMAHIGLVDIKSVSCIASVSIPSADASLHTGPVIDSLLSRQKINDFLPASVCSVSKYSQSEIETFIGKSRHINKISYLNWNSNLPVKFNYDDPGRLGTDRIANSLYAFAAFPGKNTVVVDAGTAVTVDFVSQNEVFEGGVILPGIRTQLDSLHKATALLPSTGAVLKPVVFPGTNTQDCMTAGVTIGLAGAIDGLIMKYHEMYGCLTVIACGGAWKLLSQHVRSKVVYAPDCTIIGTGLFGT
jgi:type III pantothenate kinase